MIRINLAKLLGDRSLYWLAKESGIAYSTIHKLNKEPPHGINFDTLEKLCVALKCEPGDLLVRVPGTMRDGKHANYQHRKRAATREAAGQEA